MRLLISSRVSLYCIIIDQINKLPEDGVKSLPKSLRYIENKWISQKKLNKVVLLTPYRTNIVGL